MIAIAPGQLARVTRFGLADASAAARASDLGVLAFMAPEQLSGGPSSVQADVYGLAATMLSGMNGG